MIFELEVDKNKFIKNNEIVSKYKNHAFEFIKIIRKYQHSQCKFRKILLKYKHNKMKKKYGLEIPLSLRFSKGFYLGHAYNITINPNVIIGENVSIHKGVTIGQENRGKRKGVPVIHNNVWIGINSTIVGNVHINDDVLIAPNTFINCDIPSHSVVFGNPCIIKFKKNATEGYL